jgi:hypothetical protein
MIFCGTKAAPNILCHSGFWKTAGVRELDESTLKTLVMMNGEGGYVMMTMTVTESRSTFTVRVVGFSRPRWWRFDMESWNNGKKPRSKDGWLTFQCNHGTFGSRLQVPFSCSNRPPRLEGCRLALSPFYLPWHGGLQGLRAIPASPIPPCRSGCKIYMNVTSIDLHDVSSIDPNVLKAVHRVASRRDTTCRQA